MDRPPRSRGPVPGLGGLLQATPFRGTTGVLPDGAIGVGRAVADSQPIACLSPLAGFVDFFRQTIERRFGTHHLKTV